MFAVMSSYCNVLSTRTKFVTIPVDAIFIPTMFKIESIINIGQHWNISLFSSLFKQIDNIVVVHLLLTD